MPDKLTTLNILESTVSWGRTSCATHGRRYTEKGGTPNDMLTITGDYLGKRICEQYWGVGDCISLYTSDSRLCSSRV